MKKNILWIFLGMGVVVIWLFFPTIFSWWAKYAWNVPNEQLLRASDLGPLGDIYGSLNTLISSIALCAVAISTWLQVKSLKETREANQNQLRLTKEAHDAQMKESKYAIFSNMFNALMELKQSKLENLRIKNQDGELKGFEIFNCLAEKFSDSFETVFMDSSLLTKNIVRNHFFRTLKHLNDNQKFYDLGSFFLMYENLINLVRNSQLSDQEKEYFMAAIRNSMSGAEQLTLFWMAAYSPKFQIFLKDSQLFSQFFSMKMMPFALKFYDKTYFLHSEILKHWEEFEKNQTPT